MFKIHGSINNYGSIIATTEDYKKCYKKLNTGLVGSYLKLLLATKTILFIGYSFGDEDFNKVYNTLSKETNSLLPHSFIVTTTDEDSKERFEKIGIRTIITDATFFIKALKLI